MELADITQTFILVNSGILGACMGSFLNVIAHRSVLDRPWWGRERSICESCGHVLGFWDLIPLLSFLIQKGRCRYCKKRFSVRYFIVELVSCIAFVLITYRWQLSWAALLCLVGTCGLLVNSLTDFESGDVFDLLALVPGVIALIIRVAGGFDALLDGLTGAITGWGIFAAIIIITRGGMGWGDAVFMAGAGAVLGLRFTLLAFYLGIMTGGLWAIVLMLVGKLHWGRGETLPLVPFLSIGCFIVMIWGPEIFAYLDSRLAFTEAFITSWPYSELPSV